MTPVSASFGSAPPPSSLRELLEVFTPSEGPGRTKRGWTFSLADGSRWWVAGGPQATPLLKLVAEIMRLREGYVPQAHVMLFLDRLPSPLGETSLPGPPNSWQKLKKRHRCLYYRLDSPDILVTWDRPLDATEIYVGMRDALALVYWESLRRGGLPFHAALAACRGRGVILAGPAGVGKSTCARRLPPPWQALGDDELLVVRTPEGRFLAHPLPTWSEYLLKTGTSTYGTQEPVPVAGLFFLEQGPEDEILPLRISEAAIKAMISAQTAMSHFLWYCTPEAGRLIRRHIFENAWELVKALPAYLLRVSLTGRFWEKLAAILETT